MKQNKESLEQMAKNLCNCSKKTLDDVLLFLDEESREFLISRMSELKDQIQSHKKNN